MRKLLSTFSALLLAASVSGGVVACGNANPQDYSFLVKNAQLYEGMNQDYTTSYIEGVVAQNVVNTLFGSVNPYQESLKQLASDLYNSGIINVTSNTADLSAGSTPSIGITFEAGTDYNPLYQDWIKQYAQITGQSGSGSTIANHDIELGKTYYVTPQVDKLVPEQGTTTPLDLGSLDLGAVNLADLQKLYNTKFAGIVSGGSQTKNVVNSLSDEIIDYMYKNLNINGQPAFKGYTFTPSTSTPAKPTDNHFANTTNNDVSQGLVMYGQYQTQKTVQTQHKWAKWGNIYSHYNDPKNFTSSQTPYHSGAYTLPTQITGQTGYNLENAWSQLNHIYKPYMKKGKEVRGANATSFTVHLFLAPNQLSGSWAKQ